MNKCKYCNQEVLPNEPYICDHPLGENKSHLKCFKRWLWVKEKSTLEEEPPSSNVEPSSS